MKNIELTKSVFAALLLVSAIAGAEDKYPASDFQPKVVFQDEEAGKQTGASSSNSSASAASSSSSSSSDSEYPAANFQPKVVFSDDNYKHNETISNSSSNTGSSASSESVSAAAAPAGQKEESSLGYLLGLIVLGAAGFVLFKKGAGFGASKSSGSASALRGTPGGLTGVARYVLKTSGTGVSRYLEKNAKIAPAATASESSSATGVAKYLANQAPAAESTARRAATGVEKYMRNKG